MSIQYGLFNDESEDYAEESAVEAGFYSVVDAQTAMETRYSPDDELEIHIIEEPEDEEDED